MNPRPNEHDRVAIATKLTMRLDRLPRERRMLVAALASISPNNDLGSLVEAYNSADDDSVNRVRMVERNFEVIHNFIVEIIRYGLELDGTREHSAPLNAPRDIDELRRRNVLTREQARTLTRVHEIRSGLQHWYPDMIGPEIHQAVTDLLAQLAPITQRLRKWHEAELA